MRPRWRPSPFEARGVYHRPATSGRTRWLAPRGDGKLFHLLHEHPDGAAAGEPHLPGGLVGDAELEHSRLAAVDHIERLGDHRAFDTAARHRAEEVSLLVDHQIGADRPRRRAPGLN